MAGLTPEVWNLASPRGSGYPARMCVSVTLAVGALLFFLRLPWAFSHRRLLRSVTARASLDASRGQASDRQQSLQTAGHRPSALRQNKSRQLALEVHNTTQHNLSELAVVSGDPRLECVDRQIVFNTCAIDDA